MTSDVLLWRERARPCTCQETQFHPSGGRSWHPKRIRPFIYALDTPNEQHQHQIFLADVSWRKKPVIAQIGWPKRPSSAKTLTIVRDLAMETLWLRQELCWYQPLGFVNLEGFGMCIHSPEEQKAAVKRWHADGWVEILPPATRPKCSKRHVFNCSTSSPSHSAIAFVKC